MIRGNRQVYTMADVYGNPAFNVAVPIGTLPNVRGYSIYPYYVNNLTTVDLAKRNIPEKIAGTVAVAAFTLASISILAGVASSGEPRSSQPSQPSQPVQQNPPGEIYSGMTGLLFGNKIALPSTGDPFWNQGDQINPPSDEVSFLQTAGTSVDGPLKNYAGSNAVGLEGRLVPTDQNPMGQFRVRKSLANGTQHGIERDILPYDELKVLTGRSPIYLYTDFNENSLVQTI